MMARRVLLPSVETQTVAFVEDARARGWPIVSEWVGWNGFKVYLRYVREYTIKEEPIGEVLVIANIEIPARWRRRGWFWRYCQLCIALVENGIAIESAYNPWLRDALARRKPFVEWWPNQFVLVKKRQGDWPLNLTSTADRR